MKKQEYQCWLKANLIEFAEYIRVDKAEIALLGAPSCKFVLYAYTKHRRSTQTPGHNRGTYKEKSNLLHAPDTGSTAAASQEHHQQNST